MKLEKINKELIEIGTEIQIDLTYLKEKLPLKLEEELRINPVVTVIDYKMTDSSGIGVIVKLANDSSCWFFNEELIQLRDAFNNSDKHLGENNPYESNTLIKDLYSKPYRINKELPQLISPISFIRWLLYSSKDII